jgi:hypothetical protein
MPSRFEKLEVGPERVQVMKNAFYKACAQLGLSPTPDRFTDILVTKDTPNNSCYDFVVSRGLIV